MARHGLWLLFCILLTVVLWSAFATTSTTDTGGMVAAGGVIVMTIGIAVLWLFGTLFLFLMAHVASDSEHADEGRRELIEAIHARQEASAEKPSDAGPGATGSTEP